MNIIGCEFQAESWQWNLSGDFFTRDGGHSSNAMDTTMSSTIYLPTPPLNENEIMQIAFHQLSDSGERLNYCWFINANVGEPVHETKWGWYNFLDFTTTRIFMKFATSQIKFSSYIFIATFRIKTKYMRLIYKNFFHVLSDVNLCLRMPERWMNWSAAKILFFKNTFD